MAWWNRVFGGGPRPPRFPEPYLLVVVHDMRDGGLVARRFLARGTAVRIGPDEGATVVQQALSESFVLFDDAEVVHVPAGLAVTGDFVGPDGPIAHRGYTGGLADARLAQPWLQVVLPEEYRLTLQLTEVLHEDASSRVPSRRILPARRFLEVRLEQPGQQPVHRSFPRGTPISVGPSSAATITYPHMTETVTILDADDRVTALAGWVLNTHRRDPETGLPVHVNEWLTSSWIQRPLFSRWVIVHVPGLKVTIELFEARRPEVGDLPLQAPPSPQPQQVLEVDFRPGGTDRLVVTTSNDLAERPAFHPSDFTDLYNSMGVEPAESGPYRVEVHVALPTLPVLDRPFTQWMETYDGVLFVGTIEDVLDKRFPIRLPEGVCTCDVTLARHASEPRTLVVCVQPADDVFQLPPGMRRIAPIGHTQGPVVREHAFSTGVATLVLHTTDESGEEGHHLEALGRALERLTEPEAIDLVRRARLLVWSTGADGVFSIEIHRGETQDPRALVFPLEVTDGRVWLGAAESLGGLGPRFSRVSMQRGRYSVGIRCDPDRPTHYHLLFVPVETLPPPQQELPIIR